LLLAAVYGVLAWTLVAPVQIGLLVHAAALRRRDRGRLRHRPRPQPSAAH
jgi:hypothetical protein